jgi:hypothetical protein
MNWNRSYFWNIKKDIHHATIHTHLNGDTVLEYFSNNLIIRDHYGYFKIPFLNNHNYRKNMW